VLYELAQGAAAVRPDGQDVLLDMYCGTGTIGLSLASGCREVHGFEVSSSAVADARRNAERNGITNAHFHEVTNRSECSHHNIKLSSNHKYHRREILNYIRRYAS
jgi:tRNA/tmRNA/rRNA uracil-C5-methylase (TrmA/RlmC/RlmD family)